MKGVSALLLRDKNLNLLPILLALLEEESVVAAARRVHLSQPAVSGALARLRNEFDDPLLVRVGRQMQRTARAERLLPQVKQSCADLERLFDFGVFDPAKSESRFVIAAPDHLSFLITRELLPILKVEAPGVAIHFVDPPTDLPRHLADGAIDLAVAANFGVWEGISYEPIIYERFVAAMSSRHALAGRKHVEARELDDYPGTARTGRPLAERGNEPVETGIPVLDAYSQITLEQFTDAVLLTVETDVVVAAPQMLIDHLGEFLEVVGVPFAPDYGIEAGVFWAPFLDEAPEILWLRSLVGRCLKPDHAALDGSPQTDESDAGDGR